jgi:hypothetical protein
METLTKLVVGMGQLGEHLLQKKVLGIIVAALAFACGATLALGLKREPPPAPPPTVAVAAPPCETAAPPAPAAPAPAPTEYYEEVYGPPALRAWKDSHSGTPLSIDFDLSGDWGMLHESLVVGLPSGQTLVAKGFELYLFDASTRRRWKYEMQNQAIDLAYVEATGVVCGTAQDNYMFILDAATGKELVSNSRQGRGGYGAVLKYGDDVCLITDVLGGYNADYRGGKPMMDGVTAWRGARMLWHRDVPPDAELKVAGSKIYAVTKTTRQILIKEIKPPKPKR